MYKFLLLIITLVAFGCSSNVSELELRIAKLETEIASLKRGGFSSILTEGSFPKFQFDKEEHNFGEIYDVDIVTHIFSFSLKPVFIAIRMYAPVKIYGKKFILARVGFDISFMKPVTNPVWSRKSNTAASSRNCRI